MRTRALYSDFNGPFVLQNSRKDIELKGAALNEMLQEGLMPKTQQLWRLLLDFVDQNGSKQQEDTPCRQEKTEHYWPGIEGLVFRRSMQFCDNLTYVSGIHSALTTLRDHEVPVIWVTTGFSVVSYAARNHLGYDKIYGHMNNFLRFARQGDPNPLKEQELELMVKEYHAGDISNPLYDHVIATGEVNVDVVNARSKPGLIQQHSQEHFKSLSPSELAYVGDSEVDIPAVKLMIERGGKGIFFNYELSEEQKHHLIATRGPGSLHFITPKGSAQPDMMDVVPILLH